ncbi:MAG: hypothetical protein JO261_15200 [Alphaproteobacteria bacterium]|nr:hypothetical protein [Alphaproteobacteria bacterium]MBV9695043.1 hypothetical protein [Alphaproteobacteria bacterium]
MGRINLGRVVLGGLVAGVIINLIEFILNGIVLADRWNDQMASLNRSVFDVKQIVAFNVFGFVSGIVAVWTYAALRPRFGAGPTTAIYAGLLTWVTLYLLADGMPTIMGIFPVSMFLILIGVGLVEIVAATLAGAWLYKEA